jgi:hypothetical protein
MALRGLRFVFALWSARADVRFDIALVSWILRRGQPIKRGDHTARHGGPARDGEPKLNPIVVGGGAVSGTGPPGDTMPRQPGHSAVWRGHPCEIIETR